MQGMFKCYLIFFRVTIISAICLEPLMKTFLRALVAGLYIAGPSFLSASPLDTPAGRDTITVKYYLNPITVTATKSAVTERDLVAPVSILEYSDIQQMPTSSVLEAVTLSVPSVYVTEWGVMGHGVANNAAGKISMRGLGGGADTHVLILRNGRPDFMGLMGCSIADDFSTYGLERVEVVRGPASFMYGTNATGGVINLIPRRQESNGIHFDLHTGLGSFGTKTAAAGFGAKKKRLSLYSTFSARSTDGHRTDAESGFQDSRATLNMVYAPSARTSIECNGTFSDIRINDPGTSDTPLADNWYDVIRYGGDLTITHRGFWGESVFKAHANSGDHDFFDGWESTDNMTGVMFYNTASIFSGNSTVIGFDYKRYGGKASNTLSMTDFGRFYVRESGAYLHMKQIFAKRYILTAGGRIEHSSQFGSEFIPQAGIVTHISPLTSFHVSVSKGFRSPSLRELYFFVPKNPDLKPERMTTYEAGITQYISSSLKFELTCYSSSGSNMIHPSNAGFPFTWVNSGNFTHQGLEISSKWIPSQNIRFSAGYSYLDPGDETLYAPGNKFYAQAAVNTGPLTLLVDVLHIGDLYAADNKQLPMEDYTIVNLSISSMQYRGLRVKAALKNLFDADYQSMYGYPMPGRHIMSSLSWSFDRKGW